MQNLQKSERPHIAFFGCTNSGKSSLVNAITNQNLSVVSNIKGTTTDPVSKSMEILPLGPVVIIDTAGIDDKSELGKLRIKKTNEILDKTDIAILVIDAAVDKSDYDNNIINEFIQRKIPYIIVYNKSDLIVQKENHIFYTSTITNENIEELKNKIGNIIKQNNKEKYIIKDKLTAGNIVVMVIPIDESAPKGELFYHNKILLEKF